MPLPFVIGVSLNGNFLFWEILGPEVASDNSCWTEYVLKKSKYSKQYERLLAGLRDARLEANLTQTQVGKKFGAHASFVSKCESGERRIDVVELARFCKLYGVSLSEFLESIGLA